MASLFDSTASKHTSYTGDNMASFARVKRSWQLKRAQPYIKVQNNQGQWVVYPNGGGQFLPLMNDRDPLHRVDYKCNNPFAKKRKWYETCDGTNVPTVSGNTRQVRTGGEYVQFRKDGVHLKIANFKAYGDVSHPAKNPTDIGPFMMRWGPNP